jgi:hypothetical protein
LKKDRKFRRSNYTSIENYLRNRGEHHYATKIYRNMWKRERAERAGLLTKMMLWIYGPLLFFGTNLLPLFGVILLCAVAAYPLYRHPANIEPSLARLAAHVQRDTRIFPKHLRSPTPAEWTTADAIWMEFRYQVPIVAMALRAEWTMRDEAGAIYDLSALWTDEGFPSCMPAEPRLQEGEPTLRERLPVHSRTYPVCETRWVFVIPAGAEDVAGIFTILNYIMWPLLIAFLLRRLLRTREG